NSALLTQCLRAAANKGFDENRMMEVAREANQKFKEPMMDAEVIEVAKSAYKYDSLGLNFFALPRVMVNHDIFDALNANNPDALRLLLTLERYHGGNTRFALANGMAASMGWGLPRWREARDCLVSLKLIRCAYPGGHCKNDPPIYTWAQKSLRA